MASGLLDLRLYAGLGARNTERGVLPFKDYRFYFLGRQLTRLLVYRAMQRRLAGTKPNCAVRTPMTQTTALLRAATIQPCQSFLPMRTVANTINTQER